MFQFFKALRAGAVVADPTNLKRKQQMLDAIVVLLGLVVSLAGRFGYAVELTPDDATALAGGVFVLYGIVNAGLSAASTDKIGLLPAKSESSRVDRAGDDPGGTGGPAF